MCLTETYILYNNSPSASHTIPLLVFHCSTLMNTEIYWYIMTCELVNYNIY